MLYNYTTNKIIIIFLFIYIIIIIIYVIMIKMNYNVYKVLKKTKSNDTVNCGGEGRLAMDPEACMIAIL